MGETGKSYDPQYRALRSVTGSVVCLPGQRRGPRTDRARCDTRDGAVWCNRSLDDTPERPDGRSGDRNVTGRSPAECGGGASAADISAPPGACRGKTVEFIGVCGSGKTTVRKRLLSYDSGDCAVTKWHTVRSLVEERLRMQSRLYSLARKLASFAFWAKLDRRIRWSYYENHLMPALKLDFALRHSRLVAQMLRLQRTVHGQRDARRVVRWWLEPFVGHAVARRRLRRGEVCFLDEGVAHRSLYSLMVLSPHEPAVLQLARDCAEAFPPLDVVVYLRAPAELAVRRQEHRGFVPPLVDKKGSAGRMAILDSYMQFADILAAELRKRGTAVLEISSDARRSPEQICADLLPDLCEHLDLARPFATEEGS